MNDVLFEPCWQMALKISGSLDTVQGGGKLYCLREREEARKLIVKARLSAGARDMTFAIVDGLLKGHVNGAADGQKHVMDKARASMKNS
jgi:hypothetical protein